jgi:hypothetical protein
MKIYFVAGEWGVFTHMGEGISLISSTSPFKINISTI